MCLLCHLYEILIPRTKGFPPCFLLNFMILAFTFKSVISFELILYIVWSQHSFCPHRNIQLLQHHTLKNCSFSDWIALAYLSKANWQYICGSVSGLSLFHCSIHLSSCQPHCLNYYIFTGQCEGRRKRSYTRKEGKRKGTSLAEISASCHMEK